MSRTTGRDKILSRLILVCLLLGFYVVSQEQLHAQTVYEANASANAIEGTAKVQACAGCLNGTMVGYIGNGNANYLRIKQISVPTTGVYDVQIFYTMGTDGGTRSMTIETNDDAVNTLTISGLAGDNWFAPAQPPLMVTASFTAGNGNSLGFFNATAAAPDIDHIVVAAAPNGDGGNGQPSGGAGNSSGDGSSGFVAPSDIAQYVVNDYIPQGYCQANIPWITLSYCSFYYYDRTTNSNSGTYGVWNGSFTTGGWSSSYPIKSVSGFDCLPFLYCYYQPGYFNYTAQSSLTMNLPKPGVSNVSANGITFVLRQFTVPHTDGAGNPVNGDVVTALGTSGNPIFSITEIGNRWGLHSYENVPGSSGSTNGFDITYWEPYTYSGNVNTYEDVYYTFTPDGRLRIDKFTPYLINNGTQYIWEEAVSDMGWPATTWNSDGTRTFAQLGGIAIGGTNGRNNNLDGFGELTVLKTALSTAQMIEMENSRNASSSLSAFMVPCNTGQWMNSSTVQTPCGSGGIQVPVPLPPTNINQKLFPADLSLAPQNVSFVASNNTIGYGFAEVTSYPAESEISGSAESAPWGNFSYPLRAQSYTAYLVTLDPHGLHLCQTVLGSSLPPFPGGEVFEAAIGANYPSATLSGLDTAATTPWMNPTPQGQDALTPINTQGGIWTCTPNQF
jgi:hypothetical protein